MFKHLPTLGLDEKERQALVNWGGEKITPKPQKEKKEQQSELLHFRQYKA